MDFTDIEQKKEYMDALNTYFKLKSAYEEGYSKDKRKIIKKSDSSWKERRIEYSKLIPKCINCKRPVGSLFSTVSKDGDRTLIAKCGDKKDPCPLNIIINLGYIINLGNELSNDEKGINKIKTNIIIDKNDLLFGYITSEEAVDKFDNIQESFTTVSSNYEYLLESYNNIVNNKEKKEELAKKEIELQLNIDNVKKLMANFSKTQEVQFVDDVVETYLNEITPLADYIMKNKYAYSIVDYNERNHTHELVQTPLSIDVLEWDLSTDNTRGIVSLKVGMNKMDKMDKIKKPRGPSKTKKMPKEENEFKIVVPKKKTKKNKKPVLTIESEEEEEEEEEDKNNYTPLSPHTPSSGPPTWKPKFSKENEEPKQTRIEEQNNISDFETNSDEEQPQGKKMELDSDDSDED